MFPAVFNLSPSNRFMRVITSSLELVVEVGDLD